MAFLLKNSAQASLSDIAEFERRVDLQLPEDYRRFLAANNGGKCCSGGLFREAATGESISRVNILLGLRDEPNYSLEEALSIMKERMPPDLLPICYDSGGNYLLLDCSDEHRGTVYFLGLESADLEDSPGLESLTVVARSFSELLSQLKSDD